MFPVVGFPTALDNLFGVLLAENTLTSWKCIAEKENTTIVIRLSSTSPPQNGDQQQQHTVNSYRRKPPSQLRRDHKRAQQRHETRHVAEKEASLFSPELFLSPPFSNPTVESADEVGLHDQERVTQQSDTPPSPSARETRDHDNRSKDINIPDPETTATCVAVDNNKCDTVCSEESEESKDEQFLSLAEHSGYDLHTIKETVASIRDRSLQRRLKDSDRNNSFRKVALDSRHGKKHLLLESDDIVLILDCALVEKDHGKHAIVYWFFKQDERYLLDKENTVLSNIRTWRPVQNRHYYQEIDDARVSLLTVIKVVTIYMG